MFFGMMSFKAFTRIAKAFTRIAKAFTRIAKAFTRIAFIMAIIAWPCSWLFSLDAKNIANLALTEHEAAVLQEKLAFSDAVVTVVTHAGSDITLATLLVSCPGATTMVLAREARKTKVRRRTFLAPPKCAAASFSEDARILWEGVSGGEINWFVDAGLRTVVRWLEAAKNFSETGRDPLGPQTAAEMAAGLVASSSRLNLRLAVALHRAWGVLSAVHGWMGELGLVPTEVDFRSLVASRDGSSVLAAVDLMGAHFYFWGDQISPARSGRDAKCSQQQQCRVVFKKESDEEKCRWWYPLCRLCRLAGVDARTAAREKARKEKSKAKKREEKEKERHARMEKTLESMKNNPHSWIPRWG